MPPRRVAVAAAALTATVALAACSSTATSAGHTTAHPTPTAQPTTAAITPPASGLLHFIPVAGHPPVAGTPWYLAIGDSVTFGFSIDPARAGVNSSWALQLQGLLAASGRPWQLYDTACVSERTDTYFTRCPGRAQTPFLADQSQHDAALSAIRAHRAELRAIFVDLGSNDLLQALRANIGVVTATQGLHDRLARIVGELRAAAPRVPVILGNYYDPFANLEPATRAEVATVNAMVAELARTEGARLADFATAIDGDPKQLCTWVDCAHGDIHPTIAGQARLAHVALAALDGSG